MKEIVVKLENVVKEYQMGNVKVRALDGVNLEIFKGEVKQLFEKFFEESNVTARRVGVTVSSFSKKENQQKQITSFFGGSNN